MQLEINTPNSEFIKLQLSKHKNKAPTIISRVLNRAATTARASIATEVTKEYVVKAGDIKKTLKITRATKNELGAVVRSTGTKIPLYKFKVSPGDARPKKPPKSYRAKVKKEGGLKPVLHAFVARMKSGHIGIFDRSEKPGRLPITELFGPAIPQMVWQEKIINKIQKKTMETIRKRLDHELSRLD